ncbi:MAG: CotH kinase family protein [Rikenellaceae bacterium]|nr:CotH kinase family protein [Rikenellaceae bacterium]
MRKLSTFLSFTVSLFALSGLLFLSCTNDKNEEPTPPPPPESSDCRITSFSIKNSANPSLGTNLSFTIDQDAKTIEALTIKWITGNDSFEFIPEFTATGQQVRIGSVVQESGVTKNSFIVPLEYTVVAEDGTTETYTVRFFSPQFNSTIPVIRIEQPDSRIGDDYINTKLEIIPNGWPGEVWDYSKKDVEIRLRGNSTRHLPKRPYRLKFGDAISPLGLDHTNEKSWVLVANDCDKTLMRNRVSFEWARVLQKNSAGFYDSGAILFTPSYIHVNIFMDDEYWGVYQFSDQMQRKDGRIEVEKLRARDEEDPVAITGGYVLEVDIHASNDNELPNFWFETNKTGKITIKYPDDDDYAQEQLDWIIDFVKNRAEGALYGGNFLNEWRQYFDEATAADYVIVNELAGDPDAYTSIYLYKRRSNDKLYFGPVWDFDSAFDNDNRKQNTRSRLMIDESFLHGGYGHDHWVWQMWQDDNFKRTVKNRWNANKAELLSTAMKVIEEDMALMRSSVDANFTRWDITEQALDTAMPAPANYDAGLTVLIDYINERYKYLDEVFNSVQ